MTAEEIIERIEIIISESKKDKSSPSADDTLEDIYELICDKFWGEN
ncbi:hypothetical protein KA005_14445 [bacterium]|nr:hypothetical protein [bacterium]